MTFEPDWSKIFRHHSVTDQFKEYHRQVAPYLREYPYSNPDPSRPPEDDEPPCEVTIDTRTL